MLKDAINYPSRGEDLGRRYLIGSLLTLSSILVLPTILLLGAPAFILLGYFTRVMNQTLQGEEEIPKFEDYTGLLIDGVKITGVMFTYFLVSLLPLWIVDSIGLTGSLEAVTGFFSLLFMLTVIYSVPSALVSFAREGVFKDAFRVKEVLEKAFTTKYFLGILTLIGTSILIGLVQIATLILLAVTLIGIPAIIAVLPAMRFYENIVYFRMMAKMAE